LPESRSIILSILICFPIIPSPPFQNGTAKKEKPRKMTSHGYKENERAVGSHLPTALCRC
jgi:hypothetical protein